jgi:hypothetical protein
MLLEAEIAAAAKCAQSTAALTESIPHKAATSSEAFEGCKMGTVGKACCS